MALAVPMLIWFASGIILIYTGGMPSPDREALQRSAPLDLDALRLSPSEAAARLRGASRFERVVLVTILGRPAYRFWTPSPVTVFADRGDIVNVDEPASRKIAADFLAVQPDRLRYIERLSDVDQWTLSLRDALPLHHLADDASGTDIYVSAPVGEVVMTTDSRTRALAWASAIPHWLYLSALRRHDRAWRLVVLWTAALGTIVTTAGLLLAVVERRTRRRGLLAWHYRAGVLFGPFALTWIVSGWLSMEPWWASRGAAGPAIAAALAGVPLDPTAFPAFDIREWRRLVPDGVKEIELSLASGEPSYIVQTGRGHDRIVLTARPLAMPRAPADARTRVAARLHALTGLGVVTAGILSDYDAYYRDATRRAPLPVVRAILSDPDRTWVYVDPATGLAVAHFTARQRLERWIYHGLHSLDLPFLYGRRPLWDTVMIVLCGGGLILSAIATAMAWRRVWYMLRRF